MKKINLITLFFVAMFLFFGFGCKKHVIIDGEINQVEASIIRVAVGAAMTAKPETVFPAFSISTVLLDRIDSGVSVTLKELDTLLMEEMSSVILTPSERESLKELVGLIKANISAELNINPEDTAAHMLYVRTVVEIVQDASRARLEI